MYNLIALFSINPLIIWIIAIIFLLIEIGAIINYIINDNKIDQKALELLTLNRPKDQEIKKFAYRPNDNIYRWLSRHLKGEIKNQYFHPQIYNDLFIFYHYPDFLKKEIPESPVDFAPIFLISVGIISDLLIFIPQNNRSIYFSQSEIISTFSTSITGIILAIVIFILLKIGTFTRKKYQDYLGKKFKQIGYFGTIAQSYTYSLPPEKFTLKTLLKKKSVLGFCFGLLTVILMHQSYYNQAEIKAKYEAFVTSGQLEEYGNSIKVNSKNLMTFLQENIEDTEDFYFSLTTGDLSLNNQIFFAKNQSVLTPDGKSFLRQFIPIYTKMLLSLPNLQENIHKIIVEGHSSSNGSENDNKKLSLQRSISLINYIVKEMKFEDEDYLKPKLLPKGIGEIFATQRFDNPQDNRTVFRLQLFQ